MNYSNNSQFDEMMTTNDPIKLESICPLIFGNTDNDSICTCYKLEGGTLLESTETHQQMRGPLVRAQGKVMSTAWLIHLACAERARNVRMHRVSAVC